MQAFGTSVQLGKDTQIKPELFRFSSGWKAVFCLLSELTARIKPNACW